jgi:hypothetical protein
MLNVEKEVQLGGRTGFFRRCPAIFFLGIVLGIRGILLASIGK